MGSVTGFGKNIGTAVRSATESIGAFALLIIDTVKKIPRRPFRVHLVTEQMENIGYYSLPIVLLTAIFTGMIMVLQTGVQLERFGAKLYAMGGAAIALTRELAPVLTSLVLAGRVGAGITAEIGTMKVTEQIDALETLATDPVQYLVVPRFIAAAIMLPVLTMLANVVGIAGGMFVAVFSLRLTFSLCYQTTLDWITFSDLYSGLAKSIVFGLVIACVGCYQGLTTTGGAEGVGKATTRAVVTGSVLILVSDYFLTEWLLKFLSL